MTTLNSNTLHQLEKDLDEVISARVTSNTRTGYDNNNIRFILHLWYNKREVLTDDMILILQRIQQSSSNEERCRAAILKILQRRPHICDPIKFDELDPKVFLIWALAAEKSDGTKVSIGTHNSKRSALKHMFTEFGYKQSEEFDLEIRRGFQGLKKIKVREVGKGKGKVTEGKDPFPFSLYRKICNQMLVGTNKEYLFGRLALTICWNLMCRAENMIYVCYNHMCWMDDCLGIYMKNDQSGEKPRDPRHIYANPVRPEICPILALGMYWLNFGFEEDLESHQLFSGGPQYDRFRKLLKHVCDSLNMDDDYTSMGIEESNYGTLSIRQGGATYVAGGTTAAPGMASICLRGGWKLPGVQDTYIQYEAAGDQYVGRVICGLPLDSPKFAILPPHFTCSDQVQNDLIKKYFRGINDRPQLKKIGKFALASVIYHSQWLEEKLPKEHPIFSSRLFANASRLSGLRDMVTCDTTQGPDEEVSLTPSGIPPHIMSLQFQERLNRNIELLREETAGLKNYIVNETIKGIVKKLEDRALLSGSVTPDGLADSLKRVLESAGLTTLVQHIANGGTIQQGTSPQQPQVAIHTEQASHLTGGSILPCGYKFPKCSVYQIWVLWCCGNLKENIVPLRALVPGNLKDGNQRKRLSDIAYLMKKIEDHWKTETNKAALPHQMTEDEADEIFENHKIAISIDKVSETGRKRRRVELAWSTVVKNFRSHEKELNAAPVDN